MKTVFLYAVLVFVASGCGKLEQLVSPPRVEIKIEREGKILIQGKLDAGVKIPVEVYEAVLGITADRPLK